MFQRLGRDYSFLFFDYREDLIWCFALFLLACALVPTFVTSIKGHLRGEKRLFFLLRSHFMSLIEYLIAFICSGPRLDYAEFVKQTLHYLRSDCGYHELTKEQKNELIIKLTSYPYKYFSSQLYKLLSYRRKMGADLCEAFDKMRLRISEDYAFEREMRSHLMGHHLHYFLCLFVIWFFLFYLTKTFDLNLSLRTYLLLIFIQFCGLISLITCLKFLRKKFFYFCETVRNKLEILETLLLTDLSIKEVLDESELEDIFNNSHLFQDFRFPLKRLESAIELWREAGEPLRPVVQETLVDLEFYRLQNMREFKKKMELLTFFCMAFFILPSFFIVLSVLSLGLFD